MGLVTQAEEIEVVGVFQDLPGEPGMVRRKATVEVGYRGALAEV
jgi:hypothetical protein